MNATKKLLPDWEGIEKLYRAGMISVRAIAELHEVTEGAIRKKAKNQGWERDLTAKVQQKARDELVRAEVRTAHARTHGVRTEREIVEAAALTVVTVVREHRRDISTGRNIVALLSAQLQSAAGQRDELENLIELETGEDETGERRAKLMKAVSLPVHASTLRDLSTAMKNLIGLERQAFNVPDVPEPDVPDSANSSAQAVTEGFAELKAAFAARIGKEKAAS